MTGSSTGSWRNTVLTTVPVALGYVPLGIAFGVVTVQHYPVWMPLLMSLVIYSAAGQFLFLSLMAAGAGVLETGLAMLLLGARHIFYGIALLPRLRGAGWRKPFLIHFLTDETFSLLSRQPDPFPAREGLRLALVNHLWWQGGALIGALIGQHLPFSTQGLEFALTALFIVLLIEQWQARPGLGLPALALGTALLALWCLPADHLLLGAMGGVCALLWWDAWRRRPQS